MEFKERINSDKKYWKLMALLNQKEIDGKR